MSRTLSYCSYCNFAQYIAMACMTSISIFDGLDWENHLSVPNALSDSPVFRHNLTKAELIVSHIDAHYQITKESCHKVVKTGSEFASSLAHLAYCLDVNRLPQQTCSLDGLPDPSCFDVERDLGRLNRLLLQFTSTMQDFTSWLVKPVRLLSEAQKQLLRLAELRQNFCLATAVLQTAQDRLVGNGRARTDYAPKEPDPLQLEEARATHQTAAIAYMTALRMAIRYVPLVTSLRANSLVLSALRMLVQKVSGSFDSGGGSSSTKSESLTPDVTALVNLLSRLTNSVEASRNAELPGDDCDQQQRRSQPIDLPPPSQSKLPASQIEGYLFKRTGKMTWRYWARRWFRVHNNKLVYCKQLSLVSAADLLSSTKDCLAQLRQGMLSTAVGHQSDKKHWETNGNNVQAHVEDECLIRRARLLHQATPMWKVVQSDLRLCTARDTHASTRNRFTFELISPRGGSHHLQALTADEKSQWMEALSSGLLHYQGPVSSHCSVNTEDSSSHTSFSAGGQFQQDNNSNRYLGYKPTDLLSTSNSVSSQADVGQPGIASPGRPDYDRLRNQGGIALALADNRKCADCSAEEANWASINLGVTLCTACASAHRSLGVHVSKIRSLTLDNWDPEPLHVMMSLGNRLVNRVYEMLSASSSSSSTAGRPTANSSSGDRRQWALAKWADRRFVRLPLGLNSGADTSTGGSTWFLELYRNWQNVQRQARLVRKASFASVTDRCGDSGRSHQSSVHSGVKCTQMTYRMSLLLAFCQSVRQLTQSSPATSQLPSVLPAGTEPGVLVSCLLAVGARIGCPPLMLAALAGGGHPDTAVSLGNLKESTPIRGRYSGKPPRHTVSSLNETSVCPPLVWAVHSGSLAACEFLLLNGADINASDDQNRTALFHACQLQLVHIVCLLLRRGANPTITNRENRLPLDVALDLGCADIVTLLRVQQLRENLKMHDEFLLDETATDIFQDFTSRAYFIESDTDSSNGSLDGTVEHRRTGGRRIQEPKISVSKLVTYFSGTDLHASGRTVHIKSPDSHGIHSIQPHTMESRIRFHQRSSQDNRRSANPTRFSKTSV